MLSQPYARRATRRDVDIRCDIVSRHWDEPIGHRVADLSPFGAWIDTSFPLAIGERVVLTFAPPVSRLPSRRTARLNKEIVVFAEVRRVRPSRCGTRGGMGVVFLDLGKLDRHALGHSLRAPRGRA